MSKTEAIFVIIPWKDAKFTFERDYIVKLLKACGDNLTKASRVSGIPRQNLYEKLKKLGISPEAAVYLLRLLGRCIAISRAGGG